MVSDDFLTVPEVAERLRVRTMTVYRWIESGKLPATQVGKRSHYRIRAGDLEEMLAKSQVRVEHEDPWGQAIAMNDEAAVIWAEAMRAHKYAPPDAGFPDRLRELAHAARTRARAARVADAQGLDWAAQPRALDSQPPYELRPDTGRTGPPELWEQFDAAVEAYNRAIAETSAAAVAEAADALGNLAEAIAEAHAPGRRAAKRGRQTSARRG